MAELPACIHGGGAPMVASWSSHFASMVVELPWWRVVPSLTDPAMAVGSRILPARRSGRERRSSGSGREREHAVAVGDVVGGLML